MKAKKKIDWYWTDETEQLVISYQTEKDFLKKEFIYKQLQPLLRKMIEIIGRRYFSTPFNKRNAEDLKTQVETHLVENVLHKFNSSTGKKAYSYIQTCIKHYYFDVLFRQEQTKPLPLDDFYTDDFQYDSLHREPEPDAEEVFEAVKTKANLHLQSIIYKKKDELLINGHYGNVSLEREVKVLEALYRFINTFTDYNKYFLTYYLFVSTGLSNGAIAKYLYQNGLTGLMVRKYDIQFYENIIKEYIDKHGQQVKKDKDYIRKAFNDFKNIKNGKSVFKIQDTKGNLRAASQKKKNARTNNI